MSFRLFFLFVNRQPVKYEGSSRQAKILHYIYKFHFQDKVSDKNWFIKFFNVSSTASIFIFALFQSTQLKQSVKTEAKLSSFVCFIRLSLIKFTSLY